MLTLYFTLPLTNHNEGSEAPWTKWGGCDHIQNQILWLIDSTGQDAGWVKTVGLSRQDNLLQLSSTCELTGAVLHTASWLVHLLIHWFKSSFSFRSSNLFPAQAERARELKLLHNVHHPPSVACQVSCVTCQVSHIIFFLQSGEARQEGSVINGA